MDTSVIGSRSLRMKLDIKFVRLVSLKLDISLKLDESSYKYMKEWNVHSPRVIGTLDVNEAMVSIIKYSVNMEHPSGMVMKANSWLAILLSV